MTKSKSERGSREISRETVDSLRNIGLGGLSLDAIEAGINSLSCGFDLDPVHRLELARLVSVEISSDHGCGLTESGQDAVRELLDAVSPGWNELREEYDMAVLVEVEAFRAVDRCERELRTARESARQASEARLAVMAREGEAKRSGPSVAHPAPGVDAEELASLRAMVARLESWKRELRGCRFAGGDGTCIAAELGTRMMGRRGGEAAAAEVAGEPFGEGEADGMRAEYDFTGAIRGGLFFPGGLAWRALRDLISKVRAWAEFRALAELNDFDDDQDPALDSPAQGVVRALDRWQALSGVPSGGLIGGPVAFGCAGSDMRDGVRVHLDRIEASCGDAIARAGSSVPRVAISADVLHALVWHVGAIRRCLASSTGRSPAICLAEISDIVSRGPIASGPGGADADGEIVQVYDERRILELTNQRDRAMADAAQERLFRTEDLEASSRRIADLEESSRSHAETCESDVARRVADASAVARDRGFREAESMIARWLESGRSRGVIGDSVVAEAIVQALRSGSWMPTVDSGTAPSRIAATEPSGSVILAIQKRLRDIGQMGAGVLAPDSITGGAVAREVRRISMDDPGSRILIEVAGCAANWVMEHEYDLDDGSGSIEAAYLRRFLAILD
jgi:hypothetical protein